MKLTTAVAFGFLFFAARDPEDRLVDKLVKAQRAVERADAKSQKAGAAVVAFCKAKGETFQIKANGLMGCVKAPPAPKPTK